MISHFHLQHGNKNATPTPTSTTANAPVKASEYAKTKGATKQTIEKLEQLELNDAESKYPFFILHRLVVWLFCVFVVGCVLLAFCCFFLPSLT
jgi:hypothetical protein